MLTDEVLKILEENRDEYISGAEIAKKLGVSRNAVWKAIGTLRGAGVEVDSMQNRGYKLLGDALNEAGIRKYMSVQAYDLKIFNSVTSTNDVAKEYAALGAPEGTVVIACKQTAGRGRMGRNFYSPKGCGAYFSIIVRPKRLERLLTVMTAVAVADGIEAAGGEQTSIKWVNDVFAGGKKCCGILTEAVTDLETGGIDYAVIGIGIDVHTPRGGYKGDLRGVAGAALDGVKDALNKTVAKVLDRFYELYTLGEKDEIVEKYKKRSFLAGRDVTVIKDGRELPATVLTIDDDCRLVVKYRYTLETEYLSAGEVKIKL